MKSTFSYHIVATFAAAVLFGSAGYASSNDYKDTGPSIFTKQSPLKFRSGDSGHAGAVRSVPAASAPVATRSSQNFYGSGGASAPKKAAASAPVMPSTNSNAGLFPPAARPGECFAQVIVPAQYEERQERILIKEASQRIEVVPATYENAQERVMVKAPSTRIEVVPATFKTVTERIMVTPESQQKIEVPAEYKWVEEKMLVKPAYTTWKRGDGFGRDGVENSNEILCLVEVPAEYRTVRKQVLVSPATTRVETIPAQFKEVQQTVVDTPASTKTVEVPAQYETVTVKRMVTPATQKVTPIAEQYDTVTRTVRVKESGTEWRQVLCETNATPAVIADIQEALKKQGYDVGAANGTMNPQTLTALRSYQQTENLPQGALDFETLKSLGVQQI